jgi:peptidoglycan hydrolase-like protein with peptidoglycan-binding domain
MPFKALIATVIACLALAADADAARNANVAALQVGLRARGHYAGPIDGLRGPWMTAAVRRFQRAAGITVDGIPGPQTRRALGRYGRKPFGGRLLATGKSGWDVAALQFFLALRGFPSGPFDGGFGPRTETALRGFQRWARIGADGVAGPATYAAARSARPRSPVRFSRPVRAPVTDRFGPRDNRFHSGIDFPARHGAPVRAARAGRVVHAAWDSGGYGYLVVLAHGGGVRSWYAHLSSMSVRVGRRVATGTRIGRVGASGSATGPHLHFEVRVRGAAVDPLPALR